MEAMPKLPLIYFQLKTSPASTEFSHKLKEYIRRFYNEDPEAYNKEIKDLETLRQAACNVQRDFTGCSILKKYYAQLQLLESRFPMSEDGAASVTFMWIDAYSGSLSTVTDVKFEEACILHNIGALHSELGAIDSRQTAEGMKISCTHFQCAAWAFQHLRDNYPQPRGTDLSHDILTFYINVMLGQAQECILEKSMLDNRKCTIVAKIAAQIVDYYKLALKTLGKSGEGGQDAAIVPSKTEKSWRKYLEFKVTYHGCVTYLYLGSQAEELQKMGERVSFYQSALERLNEASKLAKGLEQDISDAMTFTMDIVGGKLNAASKENEFVYHEKVPSVDSLPEVKGASLVKGIPFDPADSEISGPDIFARLVPMEAHEASSLYSEEKAKILREINAMIEDKDSELMSYLSSLQLDQLKLTSEPDRLPQEVVDCCAAFSVKPNAIKELVLAMQSLSGMFHDVESVLCEIESLLDEEHRQEKECLDAVGKRPPSMILLEIREELRKYREAHKKATESNLTLHKAMDHHIGNLNLLSAPLDQLMKNIPSLSILDSPNDEGTKKELQRLLIKVDEMRSQRQMLESQLRDQMLADDITKQLVTREDQNLQDVFVQELKKHDRMLSLIGQNLTAQDNILQALTDANARYADTRRATGEISQRRRATIAGLIASYEAYEDLIAKSQKGLEFYRKLEASVTKLLKRASSVCHVQEEERDKILESQVKKVNMKSGAQKKYPSSTTAANTGPKLKDYLKYMAPGSGGSTAPKDGNIERPFSNQTAFANHGPSYTSTSSGMIPSYTGHVELSSRQDNISRRFESEQSSYPMPVVPSSAFRPAPVGSEHTETLPPICSGGASLLPQSTQRSNDGNMPNDFYNKGYQGYGHTSNYGPESYGVTSSADNSQNFSQAAPSVGSNYSGSSYYEARPSYGTVPAVSTAPSSNYEHPYSAVRQTPGSAMTQATWYSSTAVAANPSGYAQYDDQYRTVPVPVEHNPTYALYTQPPTSGPHVAKATNNIPQAYAGADGRSIYATDSHGAFNPTHCAPTTYSSVVEQQQLHSVTSYQYSDLQVGITYGPTSNQSNYYQAPTFTGNATSRQQPPPPPPSFPTTTYAASDAYYQLPPGVNLNSASYPVQDTYSQPQNFNSSCVQPSACSISAVALKPQIQQQQHQPAQSKDGAPINKDSNLSLLQQLDFSTTSTSSSEVKTSQHCNGFQANSNHQPVASTEPKNKDVLLEALTISSTEVPVLKPKVLTVEDIVQQKEQREREARCRAASRDPFSDQATLERFVAEVEHFQKVVEGLNKQSLNGPTPLDQKWKELTEAQDKYSRRISISVARCYSLKNRVPDIMPYDCSRVEIASLKDDYINASHIKNLSKNTAHYIATQAPLGGTMRDFWTMVFEQQTEVVAVLVNDAELKGDVYWPSEKSEETEFGGALLVKLQSYKTKSWGVERIISITHNETRISRVIVHLQFTSWPPGGMPTSPSHFLQFVNEVQTFHRDQRSLSRPIVVHCSAGAGRTGVFCLVSTAIHEILAGSGIVDLWDLALKLVQMRKYVLQDKEHMKFSLHAVLYFAEDVLLKRGILIKRASFDDKVPSASSRKSSHTRHPSQDFVLPATAHDERTSADSGSGQPTDTSGTGTTATSPIKQTKDQEPQKTSSDFVLSRSNSSASVASVASIGSNASSLAPTSGASPQHLPTISRVTTASSLPPSLANLDAAHFTLEPMPRKAKKITKDSFLNAGSGALKSENGDPSDPLSLLDPLWSLHK